MGEGGAVGSGKGVVVGETAATGDEVAAASVSAGTAVSVAVASRTISLSGLTYKVQVVGGVIGLLPDDDGSQLDAQATVSIGQTDDYYLKLEAISGTISP